MVGQHIKGAIYGVDNVVLLAKAVNHAHQLAFVLEILDVQLVSRGRNRRGHHQKLSVLGH